MDLIKEKFTFLLLVFSLTTAAQNVTFTTAIDAKEILKGNYFQITFKLNNAQGGAFSPPSFKYFSVLSGPNRSSQMSIINGKTSQSMSYSYNLLAERPGTFAIEAASIKVGSKTLKSNPVTVKVIKADDSKSALGRPKSGEEAFIDLELSDSIAYVGQQVTLKYVIYTTIDVRSYNFINESEYNGFYVEDLQNYKDQATRLVKDGKQYIKQTLKAVALFPQQTGTNEIGPSLVNLGIAIKSDRPSFFFSTSMRSKRITTPSKSIQILPTPRDAPGSFSGAIGTFKMSASIDKTAIPLDGAITLTMRIEGDGDARFVSPPSQQLHGFEVYEPNLLNEEKRVINGRISSTKTYEYLLVPQAGGTYSVIPEFSYYNVDSAIYMTTYGPTYTIRVAGGSRNQTISTDTDARLVPIYTKTEFRRYSNNSLFSTGHVGFLSVCGLAFLILGGVRWRNIQQGKIDPKLLKSKKAKRIANAKLAESKIHLEKKEIKEFYSSLSDGLFDYLSRKFDISIANISKDSLTSLLSGIGLKDELGKILHDVIDRSEMAIYAGFTPEKAREDFEIAKDIIVEMEEALKAGISKV